MRAGTAARRLGAVLAITAVAISGCGTKAPSKAGYIVKANALCAAYNLKVKALGEPVAGAGAKATGVYLGKAAVLSAEETTKLQALKTPKGDKDTLAGLYARQASQVSELKAAVKALGANDTVSAEASIKQLTDSGPQLDKDFDAYGLTACGSQSGS